MPYTKSAKKRLRQNRNRKTDNSTARSLMRTEVKKTFQVIEKGDLEAARDQIRKGFKRIDKARKRNLIHANKAARMKSKLARNLHAAEKR